MRIVTTTVKESREITNIFYKVTWKGKYKVQTHENKIIKGTTIHSDESKGVS